MTECFLRLQAVSQRTGLAPSTIYKWMCRGAFPKNFRLTPNAVAWRESEIAKWQADRIASRGQPEAA